MRILGLDYGDKTIGVAVSDPFGWTAQGLTIIRRNNENEYKQSLKQLAQIIEEYQATEIVLGYPKNMDNTEGARCEKTHAFEERLKKRFPDVKIVLWDERLSTVASIRTLHEASMSVKQMKGVIDKMAAVHILQGYLDGLQKRTKDQSDKERLE